MLEASMKMVVVAVVLSAATFACSSSSGGGTTTGTCGGGAPGGHTNTACDSCTQSKCSSQFDACFSSSGACASYANGGCQGLPPTSCQSCLQSMEACQKSSCASECGGTTDSGTSEGGPPTPNCTALSSCCDAPTLPAEDKGGCQYFVGMNDDAQCAATLKGLQDSGYCH